MEKLFIIFVSQEYESANHLDFWKELSRESHVLIVNIPADLLISVIKMKYYRIRDSKQGIISLSPTLSVMRPIFVLRPDITPKQFYPYFRKSIWQQIQDNGYNINDYDCYILFYNAFWARILCDSSRKYKTIYYLFDEVKYNGTSDTINRRRLKDDTYACKNSDVVLAMSQSLIDSRKNLSNNIRLFGNGSARFDVKIEKKRERSKVISFIGLFRDWIDKELLEGLIEKRVDLRFCFAGAIEDNMKDYFMHLLNSYNNTCYLGEYRKKDIDYVYTLSDCVIVPYKQTDFIKATRPIKIVESIMHGTPVVCVPNTGYMELPFLQYATTIDEFSEKIDFVTTSPIDIKSREYILFCKENTWENKTEELNRILDEI